MTTTAETARATVLGRVRDALGHSGTAAGTGTGSAAPAAAGTTVPPGVPRTYRTGRALPDAERLALFTDRLVDYKARVHTCTAESTARVVADVLHERGARTVGVPAGLDPSWLAAYEGEVREDSAALPAPRLDALDGTVTASAAGCAETGTIFLDGSPGQGRRALSLVPDLHVCVVDLSAVAVGVPEAVARLVPERPTTLVSGPSATSDIELERVEGVHGPRTLEVVIRTDA